jgi:hypothetical protein
MISIESIDKLFAECDDASSALSGKLLGVQNDIQYRALTGTGGFNDPKLSGETKKVVDGAKSIISGIWLVVNVVTTRIDAARAKRATVGTGILSSFSGAIGEVSELLSTTPLDFSKEASKLPDVLRLQLLTGGQTTTSLANALKVGDSLLRQGAQSIIDVTVSLSALKAHIAEVEVRLVEVEPIALKVGGSAQYAHKNATANLATLKALYETDPLGVTRAFQTQVDQHIDTINGAINGVQKAKEKAYAEYGDAQVLMQRLEDRQPGAEKTSSLREWLNKLVKRLEQEDWAAASTGLEDWIRDASSVLNGRPSQPSGQTSGQPSGPAHTQPPHQQPTQRPQQPTYTPPPARQAPPPPVRVEQLPVSGDYQKYAPAGKSDLQKLLDGELKAPKAPAPAAASKPADAAVTDLVQSRPNPPGAAQQPAQTSVATSNTALDTLVNGPKKPAVTSPVPPAGQTPADNNQALGDLISGRKPKLPVTPVTSPAPPVSSAAPSAPGKPAVTQAPPPVPAAAAPTPPAASESAKLTELFTGKKAGPSGSSPSSAPAPAPAATKAPTQAEQDEAARKALEKLLKR